MTYKMKQEIEQDIKVLFEGKNLINDAKRLYRNYTLTSKLRYAIGFEVDNNEVYYALLKEDGFKR